MNGWAITEKLDADGNMIVYGWRSFDGEESDLLEGEYFLSREDGPPPPVTAKPSPQSE